MNAVGKILVMLNLVMSLVFMSFAILVYSTHKNWEVVVKGPTAELPQGLKGEIDKLVVERDKASASILALTAENAREIKARDDRLAMLETKSVSQQTELIAAQDEVKKVTEDKSKTTAAIDALIAQNGLKSDEIRQLNEKIETQRAQLVDMNLKTLELTGNVAGLSTLLAQAREQYQILFAESQRHKAMAEGKLTSTTKIKLEGVVTNATTEGLVQISLGSDDGVSRGMTFEVYREAKYLGRIEILQTTADAAVGKAIAEYRKGNIEKNDHVTTRLN
jgi:chromosome segregation ATPase